MNRAIFGAGAVVALAGSTGIANADVIGGVEFPHGLASFADRVVSYSPGTNVSSPYDQPENALGSPLDDNDSPALGNGGILVLEFVDNRLVDQDEVENGLDLFIFEVGPVVEAFRVEISTDGTTYIDLGVVRGQPRGVDIAPFITPGQEFRFVRLTDAVEGGSPSPFAGADIDAVGAISSIIPTPATGALASIGAVTLLFGRSRRGAGHA